MAAVVRNTETLTARPEAPRPIRQGHRGYVASRPIRGQSWPQHVQNLLLRDYAASHDLRYLLSITEYAMPGCYMGLQTLLDALPRLEGVLIFSLFMLPARRQRRWRVIERVFDQGARLHLVLEDREIRTLADWQNADDILSIAAVVEDMAKQEQALEVY